MSPGACASSHSAPTGAPTSYHSEHLHTADHALSVPSAISVSLPSAGEVRWWGAAAAARHHTAAATPTGRHLHSNHQGSDLDPGSPPPCAAQVEYVTKLTVQLRQREIMLKSVEDANAALQTLLDAARAKARTEVGSRRGLWLRFLSGFAARWLIAQVLS